ncbi:anti-sigma factor domain-containing protein [Bacillus sp. BGMRC 2118]|nr:anti-sigma factor domain-containing protein [Bacillus sp. BGMRC 2118]
MCVFKGICKRGDGSVKRGVILEIGNQYITLLTPEGEFLRSRKGKEHYEIGEEINFFPVNEQNSVRRSFFKLNKWNSGIASVIAAALLFFSIFNLYDRNEVYAYMTIDINPSIEAGVDKKLRVVSLEGYNAEGDEVVKKLEEWMNEPINSVTEAIIQESKDSGYYKEGVEVLLSTVIVEEEDEQLAKELSENVQSIVETSKQEDIMITSVNSTVEDREHAIEKGLSTGKYMKETLMAKEKEVEKQQDQKVKATDKGQGNGNNGNNGNNGDVKGQGRNLKNDSSPNQNSVEKGNGNSSENRGNSSDSSGVEKEKGNQNKGNQSNNGKGNQEDKKGPPEAVQKGKQKQQDNKKQGNGNNKKDNGSKN